MDWKETINSAFFGRSADQRMDDINNRISSAREALRRLLLEKQRLECTKTEFLTDRDILGLRKLMKEASLLISEGRNTARLCANLRRCSLRFHTMHGRHDTCNDNVLYVTRNLYSFQCDYMENGSARLRNITEDILIDNELSTDFDNVNYSHPHVSETSDHPFDFRSICYGSNHFPEVLRNVPVTPQDYLEFIRRFHIWATHGNVNDMYDRNAYKEPKLGLKAQNMLDNSEELFRLAQLWAKEELSSMQFLSDVSRISNVIFAHDLQAFIRCYAAWMLKNMPNFASVLGHSLPRRSLVAAAKLDLTASDLAEDDDYPRLLLIKDEIFGAPKALKLLLEEPSVRQERNVAAIRANLISQIII